MVIKSFFSKRHSTFDKGIHSCGHKELSANCAIEEMPSPSVVSIPVSQHIGKPAKPIVSIGDSVKMGQMIAQADGFVSANIFSSVSGVVQDIKELPTPSGQCQHIVIKNDGNDTPFELPILTDPSREEIVQRVKDCGIVGMGGAGFPSNIKYSPNKPVETLIINAAECEPYITCDYRVMLDYTEQFVKGALLIAKSLGLDGLIIGIEDNKPDAIQKLQDFCVNEYSNVKVSVLQAKYPQGGEKQLIYAVLGKKVPTGGLPMDVGVCVSNVATAFAVYMAVCKGETLYKRVCTVAGKGVKNPKNIWVRVGTPYSDVIDFAGGLQDTFRLISGGPMMGFAVATTDMYTTKTTGCILAMTETEAPFVYASECINCAKCSKACPMNLMPMYMSKYIIADDIEQANKYGLKNCIECGCCSFVCPAKLPLVMTFRNGKKRAMELTNR